MQWVILRAQFLYRFTHLLKEFAEHDLAVVVTNHVVDSFDDRARTAICEQCGVFKPAPNTNENMKKRRKKKEKKKKRIATENAPSQSSSSPPIVSSSLV